MSSLEATLERLGAAPVQPADLERLEARVIATHRAARADGKAEHEGDVAVVLPVVGRRRPARLAFGAVAACVLAVLVLGVAWLTDDDPALVVASADDVELVLPDGRIVAAAPGVELPTGTTIDVEGSLVVDGVTYGPGNYRVTDAGVVPAGDVGPIATTSTTSTVPGADPPVAPRPDATTSVARTTIPTRPSTSVDVPPSTREPRPDRTTTTGRDRPSTTASEPSPSDRPSTTADDPPTTSTPADRPSSTTTTIDRPTTTTTIDRPTTTRPVDRDQRPTTTESRDR